MTHSAQSKHTFWGGIKQMSKTNKLQSRKKIALELLHHRLGHISTILFMSGGTANFWKGIELRIVSDSFCTSCHGETKRAGTNQNLLQHCTTYFWHQIYATGYFP